MWTENICKTSATWLKNRKTRDTCVQLAGAPTWAVSRRVVEEAEAKRQEDERPPGDFPQQLRAADSSLLHGCEGQDDWGPNDENEPWENSFG